METIRAVLLDVDNTLLDFDKCAAAVIRTLFVEEGLPFSDGTLAVFHRINNALWKEIEQGTLTRDRLHQIRWVRIFEQLGLQQDGHAFEKRFVQGLAESHEPVEGAPALLRYLAGRYTLCIASHSTYAQQHRRLELAGMLPFVQHLFVSETIGAPKPSRAFFTHCLDQLSLPAGEVFLIGDSLTADIQGGTACGIPTCWFNPRCAELPPAFHPDFVVNSLQEIERIL